MLARSIFNIGTLDNPGHADNVASIKLKKTAPFRALLSINGDHLNQKQIAEWLEDWSDYLTAFDADGNTMKIARPLRQFAASPSSKLMPPIMKMVISVAKSR